MKRPNQIRRLVRIPRADLPAIRAAANRKGQSLAAYLIDCARRECRERTLG